MTEDFTTIALRYLLDELDEPERAAFELRLERDPAAAAVFKTCADSLGRFGLERGTPGDLAREELQMGWSELQSRVADESLRNRRLHPGRTSWQRYFWPMAAAMLLGLNLWQWFKPARPMTLNSTGTIISHEGATQSSARRLTPAEAELIAAVTRNIPPGKVADPRVAVELKRLEALRRQFEALQKDRDLLAKDYGQIVNQLIPAGSVETGAGRLVAMELVDEASYNSGNRNGLLEQAKALLTEPGIVAIPSLGTKPPAPLAGKTQESAPAPVDPKTVATTPVPAPVGTTGVATLAGTSTATVAVDASSIVASAPITTLAVSPTVDTSIAPTAAVAGNIPTGAPVPATTLPNPSAAETTTPSTPYAWSVYDDTAHQGYVNLYNLPAVSSGTVLELWIQPAGSASFQPVGQVPSQFYGGSGSLYYQLPTTTATPSQILVTVEQANTNLTAPSNKTVVHGP